MFCTSLVLLQTTTGFQKGISPLRKRFFFKYVMLVIQSLFYCSSPLPSARPVLPLPLWPRLPLPCKRLSRIVPYLSWRPDVGTTITRVRFVKLWLAVYNTLSFCDDNMDCLIYLSHSLLLKKKKVYSFYGLILN